MMKKTIWVKASFAGFHSWPDAPEKVSFLRSVHRHLFTVKAYLPVTDSNRELEFFLVQSKLLEVIRKDLLPYMQNDLTMSCEMIGEFLINMMRGNYGLILSRIEISEDGENGAVVEVDYEADKREPKRKRATKKT